MSRKTYILDPGHGGLNPSGQYVTSGKRSPIWKDGSIYYEGVGNRQIAKLVGEKLKALGIAFAFTVTPGEWEDVSLTERCKRANLLVATKECVLISIHSNAASSPLAQGFEVFTSPGQNKSDQYATIWYKIMAKEFPTLKGRPDNSDRDPDKEARFNMIMSPKCPSFLVETMFHTNENECRILMSADGRERIAKVIVATIQEIENLKNEG
jgi:N-acetylmuramoyl-L-alanine amidase